MNSDRMNDVLSNLRKGNRSIQVPPILTWLQRYKKEAINPNANYASIAQELGMTAYEYKNSWKNVK